ncbi:MAG: SxtJ family membrane protein [Lysobacterales bacterium]
MNRRRGTAIESAHDSDRAALGSNRVFGWLMAAVAALVTLWAWHHQHPTLPWALGASLILALLATVAPQLLQPLNRAWMALGHLLGRIVSPIIMALIYFGVVTPIALIARARGVDPMRRRFDPSAQSYWIAREPPGPDPKTMERQY